MPTQARATPKTILCQRQIKTELKPIKRQAMGASECGGGGAGRQGDVPGKSGDTINRPRHALSWFDKRSIVMRSWTPKYHTAPKNAHKKQVIFCTDQTVSDKKPPPQELDKSQLGLAPSRKAQFVNLIHTDLRRSERNPCDNWIIACVTRWNESTGVKTFSYKEWSFILQLCFWIQPRESNAFLNVRPQSSRWLNQLSQNKSLMSYNRIIDGIIILIMMNNNAGMIEPVRYAQMLRDALEASWLRPGLIVPQNCVFAIFSSTDFFWFSKIRAPKHSDKNICSNVDRNS